MPSSAHALQKAVFTALAANSALISALSGSRIYDDVPQPAAFPYVSFGPITVRDNDTSTERSDLHTITLHIWSRARGRQESHALADLLRATLHEQPLTLIGHSLINLRHEQTDLRRIDSGETIQTTLRFRAVTEPA